MIKVYFKDLLDNLNITDSQLNIISLKALIKSLKENNLLKEDKQQLIFCEEMLENLWTIYYNSLNFFDPNYNRKSDFKLFFDYLIRAIYNDESLNFFALFCPGYTKDGYKNYLGKTNKWKLEKLKTISEYFKSKKIKVNMDSYYSDVFLENTDSNKNEFWKDEMNYNRQLFHKEAQKYFDSVNIKNVSEISIFSDEKSLKGYIDYGIIKTVNARTYYAFKKSNQKFYEQLKFNQEQIDYRNDRLITMYKILSNYLNTQRNIIFLPMENMYERENIFSENNTCTMYLKLKK